MYLSTRILGSTAATAIASKAGEVLLQIGSDTFRRADLARVGCFNFLAAIHLSAACKAIGVRSTRDLFERFGPGALVLPGIGAVSLSVLGAAFEAKGLGGAAPLESWAAQHRAEDSTRDFVTFATLKRTDAARTAGAPRRQRRSMPPPPPSRTRAGAARRGRPIAPTSTPRVRATRARHE